MSNHNKAVYAGTFDPITNGHLWMIEAGSELFSELVLAVGVNPDKSPGLTMDDRVSLLRESCRQFPNVGVDSFGKRYLVDYAKQVGASYILRGIRNEADYAYERTMRHINNDLAPGITTVFLMPPRDLAEVSSSFVKGLVGPEGWPDVVKHYVPGPVLEMLKQRFSEDDAQ